MIARTAPLAPLLAAALLFAGCQKPKETGEATAATERPEGWESIESEEAALRLYYQFVDAKGRVRFVERLDEVPERWRANVGYVKMASPPPLSPAEAAATRKQLVGRSGTPVATTRQSTPEVILYSASWCGACRKAKRYLARQGIAYEERDVDIPAVAKELQQKTGSRAIPVIDAGGRILTGFSPAAYDALLGRA